MNNKLFTYGTLRVDEPNSQILKYHCKVPETCKTVDKFILFTQSCKAFPFMIPVSFWPEMSNYATQIVGDVYTITNVGLARCDKLEGHPDWYERTVIQIETFSGIQEAFAYILTKDAFEKEKEYDYHILETGDWKLR